jgi:Fe-S-cluster containining protein
MQPDPPSAPGNGLIAVSKNETFAFCCSRSIACFNACCRDLNQFLAPYDILQLKNFLGIDSSEFLATYTARHIGAETGLPVITLRPKDGAERECPFVTPTGCKVYPNRPSSCRLYPIARAVSRCRQTGRLTEHFALIREPHCLGFQQDHRQSVAQWLESQQLAVCLEFNDRFLELIGLKNQLSPGPLDLRCQHLFQLALYDIDSFREHIFRKGLLADWHLPAATLASLETDEVALLRFGHRFVARQLFGKKPAPAGEPAESGQTEGHHRETDPGP